MDLRPDRFTIRTKLGELYIDGFTNGSPLGLHLTPESTTPGTYSVTLLNEGLSVISSVTHKQALYAMEVLSPLPWTAPYEAELPLVNRLKFMFKSESARGTVLPRDLTSHLVKRLRDPEFYRLCGQFTETWELLVGVIATDRDWCHAQAEAWLLRQVEGGR